MRPMGEPVDTGAAPEKGVSGRIVPRPRWPRALRLARLDRHEIAGSLGDMGTFLPLLVGMAAQNGLDFPAALFFAGLFNVVTGLVFAIPMAVQPMKAIAAVALTEDLTVREILAAGVTVSVVILVLGLTGLIGWLNRVVPRSVVRGLQLALGLSLLMKGLQMVAGTRIVLGPDSYLTGAVAALLVLACCSPRRVPSALVLFGAGALLAIWKEPAGRPLAHARRRDPPLDAARLGRLRVARSPRRRCPRSR